MNICFYTGFSVSPTVGGTERISDTLARSLTKLYGCKCYSIYSEEARWGGISDAFVDSRKVLNGELDKITTLLKKWNIDVLINQSIYAYSSVLAEAAKRVGAKYVFCSHGRPGWEYYSVSFKSLYRNVGQIGRAHV